MLRALVMSIFGWRVVVRLRSTSMHVMPRRAKSRASVMPTGPPPAMRTWTSLTPVLLATTAVMQGSYFALPKPASAIPKDYTMIV
jgi:hypothetical protein